MLGCHEHKVLLKSNVIVHLDQSVRREVLSPVTQSVNNSMVGEKADSMTHSFLMEALKIDLLLFFKDDF